MKNPNIAKRLRKGSHARNLTGTPRERIAACLIFYAKKMRINIKKLPGTLEITGGLTWSSAGLAFAIIKLAQVIESGKSHYNYIDILLFIVLLIGIIIHASGIIIAAKENLK